MAYNTILIKRRPFSSGVPGAPTPGSLTVGELAFNEVNSTLYFESSLGTLAIAGSGSYVDRTTDQTINGNKTFTGSTTLSTTTWSAGSTLNFSGNVLGNIGAPSLSSDATTKQYVDDKVAGITFADVSLLSAEVYDTFVKLTEERPVTLLSGISVTDGISTDTLTTTGDATVGGSLTITGNLSVVGAFTQINTEVTATSAFDITNNGTGPALEVTQTGDQPIAVFYDDANPALYIDGKTLTPGYVGIGTSTPNEKLTVSGNISASGTIYGSGGLEVSSGAGATTLYVENGKVGINTETPNEEFTVVGDISASGNIYGLDIYARNGDFTGTMDIDGATTLGSTLSVVSTVQFDSTLTVDGTTTLNSTLDVASAATFASSVSAQGALTVDGTSTLNGAVTINDTLYVSDSSTFASSVSALGAVEFDSTLTVDGLVTINNSTTTTGSISGSAGSSYIVDFIIDGGVF